MDFNSRGSRPIQSAQQSSAGPTVTSGSKASKKRNTKAFKIATVVLLFSVTALIIAVLASLVFGGKNVGGESSLVEKDALQAVVLNSQQQPPYFGRIREINNNYVRLQEVYYLQVNQPIQPDPKQQQQNNGVSLVKLGCEIHGPRDEMIIKRSEVLYWENLKSDGQVAKAVDEYRKQNPQGQQCNQTQTQSTPTPTPTTPTPTPTPTPSTNQRR